MAHVQSSSSFVLTPEESDRLSGFPEQFAELRRRLGQRIIGQDDTVRQLLVAFFAGGHVLVNGVPGLAKTLMISTLAELFNLRFARIQFTPDLMPSDITGTSILVRNETTGTRTFRFRGGPVFTHLLLADEINRTPPKTQAALLEAMEEYQVTVGGTAHPMERPFFVLATQNPIEQEGTYPLPVTQLDRFLFKIDMDYPDVDTEFDVLATTTARGPAAIDPVMTREEVLALLGVARKIPVSEQIIERATRLVRATRVEGTGTAGPPPGAGGAASDTAEELLSWGAGPRGVQAILSASRAAAVLAGRAQVEDQDYEEVVVPALRHRILLNYHAEAEKIRPDDVIRRIREDIGDAEKQPPVDEKRGSGRLSRLLRAIADPSPSLRRKI